MTNLPFVPLGKSIPLFIHQTCASISGLSDDLLSNIEYIKSLNPECGYHMYENAEIIDFISQEYGNEILKKYLKINPEYGAARADFFRYLLLYKKGGIYVDVKSKNLAPFHTVVRPDDQYLLTKWENGPGQVSEGVGMPKGLEHVPGGEFQQSHIFAAAGHPFLREIIRRVSDNIDRYRAWRGGAGKMGVLRLTGPVPYTLGILEGIQEHPHRIVPSSRHLGLEYSIYGYKSRNHENGYAQHYTRNNGPIVKLQGSAAIEGWSYKTVRESFMLSRGLYRRVTQGARS